MNPKSVLREFIREQGGLDEEQTDARVDALLARLADAGMFIGPLTATPAMRRACYVHPNEAGETWDQCVQEWIKDPELPTGLV